MSPRKEQVEEQHRKLIAASNALRQVDGAAIAAEAEQVAAETASRLSTTIADYSATRLASAILGEVIETYQQLHQEPMLARVFAIFAAITGARFEKIATDFAEELTVLVAVRPVGND